MLLSTPEYVGNSPKRKWIGQFTNGSLRPVKDKEVSLLYLGEVLSVFELDRIVTSPAQDPFPCEPSGPLFEMGSVSLTFISPKQIG